jgi:uncharacterized protein (TIGR00251 family)
MIIAVRVQPRGSKTEIVGWHGKEIRIRVKAPPVDGAANEELIRFLARQLGVPRSAVTIVSGQGARSKRVRIDGADPGAVEALLGLPARPPRPP